MKKGFSLTEIIITITIIGILSLLGLNYVKKNVTRYDSLFYYQAYEALTKGFADAVANDVTLDGEHLCNYFLNIWNIDVAHSYCGAQEVAIINPTKTGLLNHIAKAGSYIFNNFLMTPVYGYLNWGEIATQPGYLGHWQNGEYHFDSDEPCPPGQIMGQQGNCIKDCEFPYKHWDSSMGQCKAECSCAAYLYYDNHGLSEIWSQDCGSVPTGCGPTTPCWVTNTCPYYLPKVGSILVQNGLMFDFYSNINFTAYEDTENEANSLNLTYSVITVSKPDNENITPIYFLIYPENKELFPISSEIIDNKNLLPTYLISDHNGRQNKPVTNYVSYRTAKCEKETKIPGTNNYILPHSHMAYAHFVDISNLNNYSQNYCSGAESINWLVPGAVTAPRESLELMTDIPKEIK